MKTVDITRKTGTYSLSQVSEEYNLTRDAYYKYQKRYVKLFSTGNQLFFQGRLKKIAKVINGTKYFSNFISG